MAETSLSYAAFGPKQELKEWTFDLRPLGPNDVEIKITYSGICHSDIHTISGEWGDQKWPIVPGHEIVGYITKKGAEVKHLEIGQRVGVGAQATSCLSCTECKSHKETYCLKGFLGTYGATLEDGYITKGGYAQFHRAHAHFVIPIPDAIPSAEAAPLMCAGITTYAPLKYAKVGPGSKVGVIGIGGLGHLGLKLARALGAHVVALSSSPSKRDEVLRLGAHEFLNHTSGDDLKQHEASFDVILNTVSAPLDYDKIFKLVKPHGTITNLGLPEEPIRLSPFAFGRHVSLNGTLVGSPSEISEMLELCVKHNILPQIELTPLDKVNEAIKKVLKNEARYRIVLVVDQAFEAEQATKKIRN